MWLLFAIFILFPGALATNRSRYTNVECEMLDTTYATYEECNLKILGRGIIGLNIYARLNKGPFNNAKVNISLWRKFSGYRPFIFNSTFDFCKFMAKKDQALSLPKIFLDLLKGYSNINHTCPYEHAIIVKNLVFKDEYIKFAPIPSGQYKFEVMAATNNEWKSVVRAHFLHFEF